MIIIPGQNTLADAAERIAAPDKRAQARLDAEVMPTLTAMKLDMRNTRAIGSKGDLALFITTLDRGFGERPHMLIARKREPQTHHVYFAMDDLWMILEQGLADSMARKMAAHLYGIVTRDGAFRVLDALFDFAEDLQKAKPAQRVGSQQWLAACAEDGFTIYKDGSALNG